MQRHISPYVLSVAFLVLCAAVPAQSNRDSTFHISGTVTRLGTPIGGNWVAFEGPSKASARVDAVGRYEADLPLGVWKVAVSGSSTSGITPVSRLSRPRVLRVTRPMAVVVDLYVNAVGCGGVLVVTPDGRPPTPQEEEKKDEHCQGRDFFPLPSEDGVPFEVAIGGIFPQLCSIATENRAACERQFGTYNLLTIYADQVTYTPAPNGGLLEGKGNVVILDGGRESHETSARFLISDGQAQRSY
jgi:hypothetical protein